MNSVLLTAGNAFGTPGRAPSEKFHIYRGLNGARARELFSERFSRTSGQCHPGTVISPRHLSEAPLLSILDSPGGLAVGSIPQRSCQPAPPFIFCV